MSKRVITGVVVAVTVLATACGSDKTTTSGTSAGGATVNTIEVTLTDGGCDPAEISAASGATTFHVTNEDSAAVSEFEVLDGDKILGEVENVTPGLDRSFSLTLKSGSYATKCTGASKEKGSLEVADSGTGQSGDPAARTAAVKTYLTYVAAESKLLMAAVAPFADAVKAGDVEKAKSLFAAARYHYESIEPIAESFGDLDPKIDAREGDVPATEWGGFHRIEKALWTDNTTDGMASYADQLVKDVNTLDTNIASISLEPAQIANGAVELLNEVSSSKITGEEDRYSHTDLSDFKANVEGADHAFTAVQPLLAASDATLAATIEARFKDVDTALAKYTDTSSIANGYKVYTDLTPDDTKGLSTSIDALAEPLSRVAALVLT
ncbi:MAG: efeO [Ilumatobacteraceae bacterium]|nr:efeO [Ilumatobacteraceae bacterium]